MVAKSQHRIQNLIGRYILTLGRYITNLGTYLYQILYKLRYNKCYTNLVISNVIQTWYTQRHTTTIVIKTVSKTLFKLFNLFILQAVAILHITIIVPRAINDTNKLV